MAAVDLAHHVLPWAMPSFSERRFRSAFGLGTHEANEVYSFVKSCSSPKHFLWALHFLKVYPTESLGSCFSGASENTWKKWCQKMIRLLDESLPPVSSLLEHMPTLILYL
jgi:hypothetical protein